VNGEIVGGRFRLLGPLGKGNMGEVHRAEDLEAVETDAARFVAVKRILRSRFGSPTASIADDHLIERFLREVRIMRKISHTHLPQTLAGGIDEATGLPFLAMELLDGRSLADLASECPQLPVPWAAAIGAQIADGLTAAHSASIVHRDLKPSNVMVLHGGLIKVLDFGMGRIVDDTGGSLTSEGRTVGTARYMAPEQFAMSAVTQAADLYALGCVLYELLTGVPPFTSPSPLELAQKHSSEVAPAVRLVRSDVPEGLSRLIERLLAKNPADRPENAVEVRQALLPFVAEGAQVAGWAGFDPVRWLGSGTVEEGQSSAEPAAAAASADAGMDVFRVHEKLIADYRAFTEGGTIIRDERVAAFVESDLDAKSQWPDPWVSLNPFFASGGTMLELVNDKLLHSECARIFQAGKAEGDTDCTGRPLTLHRHQREAIQTAQAGVSYVLTTGTGSGKSLSYIVPIVDRVLWARESEGALSAKRVRAIIVYPMNALANSQLKELDKYLSNGYGPGKGPVTYARYTGQESDERRREIRDNPPDILLTNYVMLELMLTRPDDRRSLIKMARGLEFLVFDELHTYRGRQGADVALLIRRVREACEADDLRCVGTSATMSSEGTAADQRAVVARLATTLFGVDVHADNVIGETLVRATDPAPDGVTAQRLATQQVPRAYAELVADPLARWIETRFGLADVDGRLVRQKPARIEDAAADLARSSGVPEEQCIRAIRQTLEAGSQARHPLTERPLFAFRLHQFLSKGDTVYVTLEEKEARYQTRDYQLVQPGSDGKILLPLAFCRECGQEYMSVWRTEKNGSVVYSARQNTAATGGRDGDGYLYVDPDRAWPATVEQVIEQRRLPESWLEFDEHGNEVVRASVRGRIPRPITVDPYGAEGYGHLAAAFIPAPFAFCLHCGVSYEQTRGRDFAKLATLDQEGRSSATSLATASIVRSLKDVPAEALDKRARKLLTFVDNRQDASLQAGHFNDFVQITQLRGALYRAALDAGAEGITHEDLPSRVAGALGLDPADYTGRSDLPPSLARNAAKTLRDVIAFRLYMDLERGWRVTMPNLEQTGLLQIHYADLEWLAGEQDRWASSHTMLRQAEAGERAQIMRALLDEMRRALAIDVQYFRDDFDTLQRASEERLVEQAAGRHRLPAAVTPRSGTLRLVPVRARQVRQISAPRALPRAAVRRLPARHRRPAVRPGGGGPGDAGCRSTAAGRPVPPPHRPDHDRFPRLRRLPDLARRDGGDRCPRSADPHLRQRRRPPREHLLPRPVRVRGRHPRRHHRSRAHRAGGPADPRAARGGVPQRRPEGALLLAHHGAGRRHLRAQRGDDAQRPADACELRPAQRPCRALGPACARDDLLRHGQQPRPVLLPALGADGGRGGGAAPARPDQRGPGPLASAGDLAGRVGSQARPGDPRDRRHRPRRGFAATCSGAEAARPRPGGAGRHERAGTRGGGDTCGVPRACRRVRGDDLVGRAVDRQGDPADAEGVRSGLRPVAWPVHRGAGGPGRAEPSGSRPHAVRAGPQHRHRPTP
jgi:hypothetical protein